MGRREVRELLMGPKRSVWSKPWLAVGLMVAVLAVGLGIGLGVGLYSKPKTPLVLAPEPAPELRPDRAAPPLYEEPLATRDALESRFLAPPPRNGAQTETLAGGAPLLPQPSPPAAEPPPMQQAALPMLAPPETSRPGTALQPAWLRFAVPAPAIGNRPMIAVVIDDMGLDKRRSERMMGLKGPLTLSFLTYAEDLERQTAAARGRGHELMLHVPMQPQSASYNPGPDVLEVGLAAAEIHRRLAWGLSRFDGFVGINNHMGSKFTSYPEGMRVVMAELKQRGLLFLDSVTSDRTVGPDVARAYGVPFAARNVFLDNDPSSQAVRAQLAKLEEFARRHGAAIAIGHPHDGTHDALAGWLPTLAAKGFVLVPVSTIVKQRPAN